MKLTVPNLYEALAELLPQIPRGRVTTYGTLAEVLGSRSAARWVGEYMVDHPHNDDCVCHRVVRSTGEPGNYIGDEESEKSVRLQAESIPLENGRVNLAACGLDAEEFHSNRPLEKLVEFQHEIAQAIRLEPFTGIPEFVAGVDVSYPGNNVAVAAYVVVETATGKPVWSDTVERPVTFPYISGFLTFRELPALLELFERVDAADRRAELVFVDGNGILHPRRAGIATCLGVLTGVPTVGVGKKLLLGTVDIEAVTPSRPAPIVWKDEPVGAAMKARRTSRPIFVSPGHLTDVDSAVRIASELFHGHRLPEPVYQADRISRNPELCVDAN